MQLSVVVPVHNGGEFLRSALQSIQNQSFCDFEVVCVDDGSTDNTPEILEEFCSQDSRFRFLTTNNFGAGAARNVGMRVAKGSHYYFLDADDILMPEAFQVMAESVDRFDPDVLVFKYRELNHKSGRIGSRNLGVQDWCAQFDFSHKPPEDTIFQVATPEAWIRLFRAQFINSHELCFQEIPRTNDLFFSWSAMAIAESVVFLNRPLLFHRIARGASLQDSNDLTPMAPVEALHAVANRLSTQLSQSEDLTRSFVNAAVSVGKYHLSRLETEKSIEIACQGFCALLETFNAYDKPTEYFDVRSDWGLIRELFKGDAREYFFLTRASEIHKSTSLKLRTDLMESRMSGTEENTIASKTSPAFNVPFRRGARKIKKRFRPALLRTKVLRK